MKHELLNSDYLKYQVMNNNPGTDRVVLIHSNPITKENRWTAISVNGLDEVVGIGTGMSKSNALFNLKQNLIKNLVDISIGIKLAHYKDPTSDDTIKLNGKES